MLHLHWNWARPEDLDRGIRIAVSACGESHPRHEVSSRPVEVTCQRCLSKIAALAAEEEEKSMTDRSDSEVDSMSGPQLVEVYNAIRERSGQSKIKKFRDLETGRRTLIRAMREAATVEAPAVPSHEGNSKTKRAEKFSREAEIEIVESRVRSKGQTKKRWEMLLGSEDKTVGNYLDNIGTSGDLTWWIKQEKIRVR